jgi:hypothetical protein
MAQGLVSANMAYDFNGDGRITSADARALSLDPTLADPFNNSQPTTDTFDVSQIDLDAIDFNALNESLADLNLDNLDIPTYEDINAALTGGSPTPSSLEGYVSAFNNQVNLLSSAGTLENVDIDDRPYWYNSTVSGILGDNKLDPALLDDFKASAGIPDSFAVYDSGAGITEQSAQTVYGLLSSTDDPMQALSEYYGIDLSRAENPDAVYNNADKYGSDADRLAEFQSIIEPVLQKVIPYIQVTQGLRYDDALEYAYKNDPMIAAIYNQYGVDLFRQTSDGSTYFFDPISGTESRTVEVKDSSFRDVGLALSVAAFSWGMGGALSGAIQNSSLGGLLGGAGSNIVGSAIGSGLATGIATGFDSEAVLDAMVQAGMTAGTIELLKTDAVREALNALGEQLNVPTEFVDTYETVDDAGNVLDTVSETQEAMGLGDTLATLLGGQGDWQRTVETTAEGVDILGAVKPFFFEQSVDSLLDLVPSEVWTAIDPALTAGSEGLLALINAVNSAGTGAGGLGGEGSGGVFTLPTEVPTTSETPSEVDSDNDGVVDAQDPDDDNDGVVDEQDATPPATTPPTTTTTPPQTTDTDGDTIPDAVDPDDDNDGTVDTADADDNNDGVLDTQDPEVVVDITDETDVFGDTTADDTTAEEPTPVVNVPDTTTTGGVGEGDQGDGVVIVGSETDTPGGGFGNDDEDQVVVTTGGDTTDTGANIAKTAISMFGLGGMLSGGTGTPKTVLPQAFTQQLPTDLSKVQLPTPYQSKDYLADLIARLKA